MAYSMYILLVALVLSCPQADPDDILEAIKWAEEDENIGWVQTFHPTQYCLIDNNPYTVKIEFEKGESLKTLQCYRPWRISKWYCEECVEKCPPILVQIL